MFLLNTEIFLKKTQIFLNIRVNRTLRMPRKECWITYLQILFFSQDWLLESLPSKAKLPHATLGLHCAWKNTKFVFVVVLVQDIFGSFF